MITIIMHIFYRNPSWRERVNRDYLQSLYDHLKRLAFVVMESESKTKGCINSSIGRLSKTTFYALDRKIRDILFCPIL